MIKISRISASIFLVVLGTSASGAEDKEAKKSIRLVLEQYRGDTWKVVDPKTVFNPGDAIRFRFTSDFDGYLYVLNETPRGSYLWLFPTPESGVANSVARGKEQRIPATDGGFKIPAEAGYDTLYWIVSPIMLPKAPVLPAEKAPGAQQPVPGTLIPRCQPGALRARGVCVDDAAGVHDAGAKVPWPQEVLGKEAAARELKFDQDQVSTQITTRGIGPVVYRFRVGHR